MKIIYTLALTLLVFSASAASCGPITSVSIVGDHDTDWVAGANVKLKSSYVRITTKNSSELTEVLTNAIVSYDEEEDTKGYFVCLDQFTTYRNNRQKFATVTAFRLWKDGKLIAKSRK